MIAWPKTFDLSKKKKVLLLGWQKYPLRSPEGSFSNSNWVTHL